VAVLVDCDACVMGLSLVLRTYAMERWYRSRDIALALGCRWLCGDGERPLEGFLCLPSGVALSLTF
jgi:hypothetical protein